MYFTLNFAPSAAVGTTNEILQENHYYPFGLALNGPWINDAANDNLYQYNGKELNSDFGLGWYDYGARWYDAAVGRWWSVDPMAGRFIQNSPYNYAFDNPLIFTDPTGMAPEDYIFLNTKGEEIFRIGDPNNNVVSIVPDEKLEAFSNIPMGLSMENTINSRLAISINYEINGIEAFYQESAKDILEPGDRFYKSQRDGATGEYRNDIAIEHGAMLTLQNNIITVGEKGDPINNTPLHTYYPRESQSQFLPDEVAVVHTHPNEGKKPFAAGPQRAYCKDNGPSTHDQKDGMQPKPGFYNIVVDKNSIHFFDYNKVITISKSKL